MTSLPEADWFEKMAYLIGRREIFAIEGDSMHPVLRDGDRVLINPRGKVRVGDIVLANHPFKSSVRIIKRVAQIHDDGRCFLVGDNALESSDSRSFGALRPEDILGRATCLIV